MSANGAIRMSVEVCDHESLPMLNSANGNVIRVPKSRQKTMLGLKSGMKLTIIDQEIKKKLYIACIFTLSSHSM